MAVIPANTGIQITNPWMPELVRHDVNGALLNSVYSVAKVFQFYLADHLVAQVDRHGLFCADCVDHIGNRQHGDIRRMG